MEEQKKIQENTPEETKQEETKAVKKAPKINKQLAAIIGAVALVIIIIIAAIVGGGKDGGNDESGGQNNNPSDSGGSNSGDNGGAGSGGENGNNGGASNNTTSSEGTLDDNTSSKPISFYQFATGYSEGLAFVAKGKHGFNPTCIDKNGNELFSFESGTVLSGFNNGWAILSKWDYEEQKDVIFLCDKNGNIKTAEDLGGDALVYREGAFEDGYIFVEKTTTNYQGSVDELAIFNSKLEKTVDFSKELHYYCFSDDDYYNRWYYNGYLIINDAGYIDLKNGKFALIEPGFYENLPLKNKTDFWDAGERYNGRFSSANGEEYFIYDELYLKELLISEYHPTITPLIDLSDNKSIRLSSRNEATGGAFIDGYAGAVFEVADSQVGGRTYFTMMDENGDYCFEPIETNGIVEQIKGENGVFILYNVNKARNKASVEVYDKSGRIASIEFEVNYYHYFNIYFSDNTICLRYAPWSSANADKTWIGVYNTKLEPIFAVEPVVNN